MLRLETDLKSGLERVWKHLGLSYNGSITRRKGVKLPVWLC